jgi:hypothetical protein
LRKAIANPGKPCQSVLEQERNNLPIKSRERYMQTRQLGIFATATVASSLLLGTVFTHSANACIHNKVNSAVQWFSSAASAESIAAKIGLGLLATGTVGAVTCSISRRQTAPSDLQLQSIKTPAEGLSH